MFFKTFFSGYLWGYQSNIPKEFCSISIIPLQIVNAPRKPHIWDHRIGMFMFGGWDYSQLGDQHDKKHSLTIRFFFSVFGAWMFFSLNPQIFGCLNGLKFTKPCTSRLARELNHLNSWNSFESNRTNKFLESGNWKLRKWQGIMSAQVRVVPN